MKSFVFLVILLSGSFLLSAAAEEKGKEPQTQTQTQPAEVIVKYEIIQKGTYSGMKESIAQVISTQKDWEELWKKHISLLVPQPPIPQVDFETSVIVAIFSGEKRSSGYQVILKDISAKEGDVVVTYRETEPPPNSLTLPVITQPFVLLKVDKPMGSVRLEKK